MKNEKADALGGSLTTRFGILVASEQSFGFAAIPSGPGSAVRLRTTAHFKGRLFENLL